MEHLIKFVVADSGVLSKPAPHKAANRYTMKQKSVSILILTFILLIAKPIDSFAKGGGGTYILIGTALSKTGDTLKNQQIIMYFKDRVDTLQTDSKGYYETKIHWAIPCQSGRAPWQRRRALKKHNPKYIFFSYKEIKIKIKNDWKGFLSSEFDDPKSRIKKENLVF